MWRICYGYVESAPECLYTGQSGKTLEHQPKEHKKAL